LLQSKNGKVHFICGLIDIEFEPKNFFFSRTYARGHHGPKLKNRKLAKKLSSAALKKNFKDSYCPKGPLQHIKIWLPIFYFGKLY
jgi:hypothetical protein